MGTESLGEGADNHLSKPMELSDLLDRVKVLSAKVRLKGVLRGFAWQSRGRLRRCAGGLLLFDEGSCFLGAIVGDQEADLS